MEKPVYSAHCVKEFKLVSLQRLYAVVHRQTEGSVNRHYVTCLLLFDMYDSVFTDSSVIYFCRRAKLSKCTKVTSKSRSL